MEHKQRTERVLALIKPFPQYDPLSHVKQKLNVEPALNIDSPLNFQGFVKRVTTYKPEHWAAIPNAAVCLARRGFICVGGCRVQCCECKAEIEMKHNASGKKEIASVAEKYHENNCKWRFICTPKVFFRIPSIPGKLYQDLKASLENLIDIGPRLPIIYYSSLITSENISDFVKSMLKSVGSVVGVVQTSALLLALCGWVKVSKTVIQCNFCQRQCAIWNFFSVEDDGWAVFPSRVNVSEDTCNVSLKDRIMNGTLSCESFDVNKDDPTIDVCPRVPRETEKEDTQSTDSRDLSETYNCGSAYSNFNEMEEVPESDSMYSDLEEDSSISSEESVQNISTSGSCDTSKSLFLQNKCKQRMHPVSLQTKNSCQKQYVKLTDKKHERRDAEANGAEEISDNLEDMSCDDSEVIFDEESENYGNFSNSIGSEEVEIISLNDDHLYYKNREDEEKFNIEDAYCSEEESIKNELILENVDDDNTSYAKIVDPENIGRSQYMMICDDNTYAELCIKSQNKYEDISKISDFENVDGESMDLEKELIVCPNIELQKSYNHTIQCSRDVLHENEQSSSLKDSENKTYCSTNNLPKIVSVMTLNNPEINNNNNFSPKNDCNESKLEIIIQPDVCPSIDKVKLSKLKENVLCVNYNDKNTQPTTETDGSSLDGDNSKMCTNLTPSSISFISDENKSNSFQNELCFENNNCEGESREIDEVTLRPVAIANDILNVILGKDVFINKNQLEIFNKAESSNNVKNLNLKVHEIEKDINLSMDESKLSKNKTEPEENTFGNKITRKEFFTNGSKEDPGITCTSNTNFSIEKSQNMFQIESVISTENRYINNGQEESENVLKSLENLDSIEHKSCQSPIQPITKNVIKRESSLSRENTSISQVMNLKRTSDGDVDSLCNESNNLQDEQSDVNLIDNTIRDKCNSKIHRLEISQKFIAGFDSYEENQPQENSKGMNEKQESSENNALLSDDFKDYGLEPINESSCNIQGAVSSFADANAKLMVQFSQSEISNDMVNECVEDDTSNLKHEMCSLNDCEKKKDCINKLLRSIDDGCSFIPNTSKKNYLSMNYEEMKISECHQHGNGIERGLPVKIFEEESKKLSDNSTEKEGTRNSKRKYEEIQETDEINEYPTKIFKLDVNKSLFHPIYEHRFWCIWRKNQLSSDYQKKRGWEFAFECIQDYIKNYEVEEKLDKFEKYLQCLETLYKY